MTEPLHIPILRHGRVYESVETAAVPSVQGAGTRARMSLANAGLIRRDVRRLPAARAALEALSAEQLVGLCVEAARIWMEDDLPCGDTSLSVDDYVALASDTTGLPQGMIRGNMHKIAHVLGEMRTILDGLTRGLPLSILDDLLGMHDGVAVGLVPTAGSLAAVLPSNSPGVHSLWIPAIPLKTPVVLKPGSADPWTPLRIVEALKKAGVPAEAFGFYPTDHAGSDALVEAHDRALVFGGAPTVKKYAHRPEVQVHGPGYAKVVLGPDTAPRWEAHVDVVASSVARNGGRSCINASTVVTPSHGRDLALGLARSLSAIEARALDAEDAGLAAFSDPAMAERIDAAVTAGLQTPGAEDLSAPLREGPRRVTVDGLTYLRPTVLWITDPEHPLARTEFPFPFVTVVERPVDQVAKWIGPTLVVAAITDDPALRRQLVLAPHVDRLHLGRLPTTAIRWDQPHEGNLFEWLYRRRAVAGDLFGDVEPATAVEA